MKVRMTTSTPPRCTGCHRRPITPGGAARLLSGVGRVRAVRGGARVDDAWRARHRHLRIQARLALGG